MNEISIITIHTQHDDPSTEAWSSHERAVERARYLAFNAIREGNSLAVAEWDGVTVYSWDGIEEERIEHRMVTLHGEGDATA